jgi:SAM-dependent methyltransferase
LEKAWSDYLSVQRGKWFEVPIGNRRMSTEEFGRLGDEELLRLWDKGRQESSEGEAFSSRGWYYLLYAPILKGKKVLDVGCGFGIDGVTFAQNGAEITFLDIVESNIRAVQRICRSLDVQNAEFVYLENAESLETLSGDYDFIWCQGSMINSPFELAKQETHALLKHLKADGRWIELAYPKTRWQREGELPFERWGDKTDGGAPWMEWYDAEKLHSRLSPVRFRTVLSFEFHDSDFIWFDFVRDDSA